MVPYRVLIDARSAVLHALFTGKAKGSLVRIPETDETLNPPSHGVAQFIELHLKQLLDLHGTLPLIYVWDGDNSAELRREIYPDYKKSRAERTDTERQVFEETFTAVKKLLAGLGILQASVKGMEADDVIAFMAHKFKTGRIIYTRDADLWQLHNDADCTVEFLGANAPKLISQVLPRHIPLYKALVGDTSDDIPGVSGFGPKSWEKLLERYEEEGIDELHEMIAGARRGELAGLAQEYDDRELKLICEQFQAATRCYQLAALHPEWVNSYLGGKLRNLVWYKRLPSRERIEVALGELGLRNFVSDFEPYLPVEVLVDASNIDENRDEIMDAVADSFVVPFDYETYDSLCHPAFQEAAGVKDEDDSDEAPSTGSYVDVLSQRLTGGSFCVGKSLETVIYVPTLHADTANLSLEAFKEFALSIFNAGQPLVAHNASFEWQVTKQCLDFTLDKIQDTAIWASYWDEKHRKGLKYLSKVVLNYQQQTYQEVLAGRPDMRAITGAEVLHYGCDDALVSGHLWHLFTTVCELEGTYDFVMEQEFEAMQEFYRGFEVGIRIDEEEMAAQRAMDAKTMAESDATIKRLLEENCGEQFPEGVEEYWNTIKDEQRTLFQAQYNAKVEKGEELQHDWVEVKLSAMKAKLLEGSAYIPPTVRQPDVEFKPTAAQFTKVTDALGLAPIEKVTRAFLNEWLEANPLVMQENGLRVPENSEANSFKAMLGAAVPFIKERTGEAYDALAAFCSGILAREAKPVIEGEDLNYGSPDQMRSLFYCKLGLPVRMRSKLQFNQQRYKLGLPGSPATDKKAIAMAFANDTPPGTWERELLDALLKYKKALKREQSMWRPYPLWVHPATGNIHAGVRGCGTETRRPTSSSPNIFQVAKGDREPPHPRKTIRTLRDDFVIVDPDFNGQELRILASECKDPAMLDAYLGPVKKDLHTLVTKDILHHVLPVRDTKIYDFMLELGWLKRNVNPTYEEVNQWRKWNAESLTPELFEKKELAKATGLNFEQLVGIGEAVSLTRDKAGKPTNFLIVYGGGFNTLSQNTAMPVELCRLIIDETLNNTYVRLKPWTQEVVEFARQHGYVETAYGTRKHVHIALYSSDRALSSRVERQLANFLIQGCAADMLKIVLSNIRRRKLHERFGSYLMAPVYDELVYHVHKDALIDFSMELMECMRVTPPGHAVPMVPELSLGFRNWHDLVGLGDNPNEVSIRHAAEKAGLILP